MRTRSDYTESLSADRMRVLWVKAGKLLPVDTGGKIRSYNILLHLVRNHDVTLLSYYPGAKDPSYEASLKSEFRGAQTVCTRGSEGSKLFQSLSYLRHFFRPAPFAVSQFTHPEVRRLLKSWMQEGLFEVCVCDFLAAALNFPDPLPTPTLLFQHNVETELWRRRAKAESNTGKRLVYHIEAVKVAHCERQTIRRFRHVVAVSDHDRRLMLEMVPNCAISVVPTGVDTQKFTPAPPSKADPPRIIFTGSMDWEPNIDAVVYFCRQIFPRVQAAFPTAIFQIVGRTPHPRVKKLESPGVQVTGTVPSVAEYLRDATVVVVPLRAGSGTRLKIFEAMAMGKVVVSTSIGAEGLNVKNGHDLILADDAVAFAEAIILLVRNDQIRHQYERAASEQAARRDWSTIAEHFAKVLLAVRDRQSEPKDANFASTPQ